jgi:hypothetical protein
MLRRSVSFCNAVLLVVGLPVHSLAVSTAVKFEATSSTSRELGSTLASFESVTIAANLAVGDGVFLVFLFTHHAGQVGGASF